jgi:uncharacterized membrane protein
MEEHAPDSAHSVISKGRLEFLFDGIFAIAMTILVLELKVPELADRHSVGEMARALRHDGATFGSYLLSFAVLGVFWYRHNQFYRHLKYITEGGLALHLLQLAMAAFFPFCAALVGRYPGNPLAMLFYVGCAMVYQWAARLLRFLAVREGALLAESSPEEAAKRRRRELLSTLGITALFVLYLVQMLNR